MPIYIFSVVTARFLSLSELPVKYFHLYVEVPVSKLLFLSRVLENTAVMEVVRCSESRL